jgi:hypothetical protein
MGGHIAKGGTTVSITWYEGIGWLVEGLLMVLAVVFVGSTISEGEIRPIVVSVLGFGIVIGVWTWTMIKYGK